MCKRSYKSKMCYHSKFGHSAFARISELSVADRIVTNAGIDSSVMTPFADHRMDIRFA